MTPKQQALRCDTNNHMTTGWGKVVREFYNEDGKKVRIYENGCSIIGEPNLAAKNEVARNILHFLIENPSILGSEIVSDGGCIQIYFRD